MRWMCGPNLESVPKTVFSQAGRDGRTDGPGDDNTPSAERPRGKNDTFARANSSSYSTVKVRNAVKLHFLHKQYYNCGDFL